MKNQRSNIIICTLLLLFLSFAMLGSASATVFSSNFVKNLSLLADPDEIYNHGNPKMTVSGQFVHVLWWAATRDWSVNVIFYIPVLTHQIRLSISRWSIVKILEIS
jgi:hypothetical protein